MIQAAEELTRNVKVAADLCRGLAQAAEERGLSFSDEVHRLLEASLGLHDGSALIRDGHAAPLRRRWRCDPYGKSAVYLRDSVAARINDAAQANRWSVADEVNKRLAESLESQREKAA